MSLDGNSFPIGTSEETIREFLGEPLSAVDLPLIGRRRLAYRVPTRYPTSLTVILDSEGRALSFKVFIRSSDGAPLKE